MGAGGVAAMAGAYRDPRRVMARQVAEGLSEPRALAHLMLACGLGFVASLPAAARTARGIAADDPLEAAIAAHLFGYLVLAPLILYALATLVHLAARAFGARGGFLAARAAVFWSALLAAPLALGFALARLAAEAAGGGPLLLWLDYLVYAGSAFWLWLFAATLAEAEGLGATAPVAAAVAALAAALVFGLGTLAEAAPAAG
jgi:hypothetical protein